jgi:DnaK suppressor protein
MDNERARALLKAERSRLEGLLTQTADDGRDDRSEANEPGDLTDPAERLTAEQGDDAVEAGLRDRLSAVERAERRIEDGTFGYSILSGDPIPDARLEADPAAELTVDEAKRG